MAQPTVSPLQGKIVHVYNPVPGTAVYTDLSGTGHVMTPQPGNWVVFTMTAAVIPGAWLTDFSIRSDYGQGSWVLGRNGLSREGAANPGNFSATDFGTGNEIWIILDPAGPTNVPPAILTSAPKVINVLNPWPTTGPKLVVPGGKKNMLTVEGRCGWFTTFLLRPADYQVYFAEISDADTYGKSGYGSVDAFDLTAEFAAKGDTLWLDKDFNVWSQKWPGKDGDCQYMMAATVRDFVIAHPDFDFSGLSGDQSMKGMVQPTLGPDRKMVPSGKTSPIFNRFDTWFKTDSEAALPLRNYETCVDIPMGKTGDGLWEYDSYNTPEKGFWPIENFNRHNETTPGSCYKNFATGNYVQGLAARNMNFCMEAHAKFIYRKGQKFSFRGDDDVWVFINNKLVIDLGGIHEALADSVNLDDLGLEEGKEYNWDFFYCERQPCGSSLRIKTSIFFRQQRALDTVMTPGATGIVRAKIIKRVGGTGSCAALGDEVKVEDAKPGSLVYQLWNVGGTPLDTLGEGTFFNGGIVIATPDVTVDTSKIDLPPGTYRVVAFEPANQGVRAEVPFTIRNRLVVQFEPNQDKSVLLGTLVPVVAANRLNDITPPEGVGQYTPNLPAGLEVYQDRAKTIPVVNGTVLSTEANGLDTLWVTGNPAALADMQYVISMAVPLSQRRVTLTFTLPPLDVPLVTSASIHDDDADGIPDRISAVYDRDIAALLPTRVAYQWPATAAAVSVAAAELAGKLEAGTTLTLKDKPLIGTVQTSGPGTFASVYPGRGKEETQTVPLVDKIAPVLLKAQMFSGTDYDTLRLVLSEAVATGAVTAPGVDLFTYRLTQTGVDLRFAPASVAWSSSRDTVSLTFPIDATDAPRPGQLVRVMDGPGRIADAAGNGAGPNSLLRRITGVPRPEIKTVTFMKIDPALITGNEPPITISLEQGNPKVEDVVSRTGRLGHLIKVDLGEFAQSDGFKKVDPAKVFLNYQVSYFTNLGIPVFSEKKSIACTDQTLFQGDCLTRRGFVFLGWGYTTLTRQRVATGAYVVKLQFKVTVEGETEAAGGLDQTWGVLRGF